MPGVRFAINKKECEQVPLSSAIAHEIRQAVSLRELSVSV